MTIYERLFGTPERAAKALMAADISVTDYHYLMYALSDDEEVRCRNCPYECMPMVDNCFVCEPKDMRYIDWLMSDVDE